MKRFVALLLLCCLLLPAAALGEDKLPKVKFEGANYVGNLGDSYSMSLTVSNAGKFSGAKTLELRDQDGMVLATREYKVGQKVSFKLTYEESMLGGHELSVWCDGEKISLNSSYIAIADKHRKAFSIPNELVDTPENYMCVTLDCCYTDPHTDEILAVLDKYNVKATFFMAGEYLINFPESAKKIRDAGHEIGTHSLSHPHLLTYALDMRFKQVRRNVELVREVLGVNPRVFRPPFGEFDFTITAPVRAEGMELVLWTVDSKDWKWEFAQDPQNVIKRVEKDAGPGSVILFHLDGWNTTQVLDVVIPYYQDTLGLKLVTVSELIESTGLELPALPYNAVEESHAAESTAS